jgi:hypothetical protein
MCWNAEISLNTFLFSGFVLLLLMYNNNYTQYKIQFIEGVNNIWVYIFVWSFILMQLVEFFIWKNMDNPKWNSFFTSLTSILLFIQPMTTIMFLPVHIRLYVMFSYLFLAIPFVIYRFITKKQYSSISPMKHLHWHNVINTDEWLIDFIWGCFFLLPFLYTRSLFAFSFAIITCSIMAYKYYKDRTVGSMWCWVVNSIMVYYAAYLLLYLPFYK